MKREIKQVWTGISRSVTAAAASAELTGNVTLNLVGAADEARQGLLLQCSNNSVEAAALKRLLDKNTTDSQMAAGRLAVRQLFRKWSSED